jgi:hypothetical protein
MVGANGNNGSNGSNGQNGDHAARVGTIRVKQGLAQMLKGGVIVSRFNRIDINFLLDANTELQARFNNRKATIGFTLLSF